MRPHPRIRKTIKYGGTALTVLLAGVLITSRWWNYSWHWGFFTAYSFSGALALSYSTTPGRTPQYGLSVTPYLHTGIDWWSAPECGPYTLANGMNRYTGWQLRVPTVLPLAMVFSATALAFRLDTLARRRERGGVNLCKHCGYDRTGLAGGADAVCPECGSGSNGGSPT